MFRGAVYGLTAGAIWGGLYVVSDVVLTTVTPFVLLSVRLALGIAVLLPLIHWQGRAMGEGRRWPRRREALQALGVGFVGFGVSVGAQFVGTDKSTAINGALITSASPAFILLFAAVILRERLTGLRVIAVALATIGVIIIIDPRQADFGSETFVGDVSLLVAAVTWGLYSVLVRHLSARLNTLMLTLLGFCGGLLLTVPAAIMEASQRPSGTLTPGVLLGVLYLGVISTAGAMWLWNRAFALVDASVASLFFFAQPVVGALLSILILNQPVTWNLAVGSLLIAGGVLLSLNSGHVRLRRFRRTVT